MTTIPPVPEFIQELPPDEPQRPPHLAFWLFYLFLKPRRFFAHFPYLAAGFTVLYATYVVGVAQMIDTFSTQLTNEELKGVNGPFHRAAQSWGLYWGICLGMGILAAVFLYGIGGWWYNKRLVFCKVAEPDITLARRVYIFATLVAALPLLLLAAVDTALYASPLEANRAGPLYYLAGLLFLFWSVYVSYRGVRTVFDAAAWRARVWFLLLPSGVYGISLVVIGLLFAANFFMNAVDLSTTHRIDRTAFTLRYPGNWIVNEAADGYDPDYAFSVQPPLHDAIVQFFVANEPEDPDFDTELMLDLYQPLFTPVDETMESFTTWGSMAGSGTQYDGTYEGSEYRIRIFSASTETHSVSLVELCEKSVCGEVEPGFEFVRNSFRFKQQSRSGRRNRDEAAP